MTQVLKNKKGVTLVELLAVIVIMGIIAAIAVPAIGGLIDNSKINAVEAQISAIEDAARLYANANPGITSGTVADLNPAYITVDASFNTIAFTISTSGVVSFTDGTYAITFNGDNFSAVASGNNWTVTRS